MGPSYTPIQIEWFYYLEGEKTKLNWFLLEIALEYYDRIRDSQALAPYREQYDENQIAQFCAYYARRMKKGMLDCLRGRRKTIVVDQGYITDFYPQHSGQLNDLLLSVAKEAVDHMLSGCKHCPQGCLYDYQAKSPLFDTYKS
jgi:hypothetical protein